MQFSRGSLGDCSVFSALFASGHGLIRSAELAHRKFTALSNLCGGVGGILRTNRLDVPETGEIRRIKMESNRPISELQKGTGNMQSLRDRNG
jgi:hypothetical protein